MNFPEKCEVVVVGGGPAGSLTATYLAQKGHDVVLLDKQKHPRYNVGESLIPDFWKYTDMAGASGKILADGFIQKAGGTVSWKGRINTHTFRGFGYKRPALHVERDRFDHILLENAREKGVKVFEETGVTTTNFDDPGNPVVHYRYQDQPAGDLACKYVVDASGQSAVVARQLGLRVVDEAFRFMSVWGYFKDSRYIAFGGKAHRPKDLSQAPPTTFVSSLGDSGEAGWSWHIILRDVTSVGFVLPIEMMKSVRETDEAWEKFFVRKCQQSPVLNRLLEQATFVPDSVRLIRDYSYRSTRLAGPGYFLVGDAAGFVDPIFSVGVVLAMYSAYAAAWALDRCLRDPGSATETQEIFQWQLQGRHEIARSLALPRYQTDDGVSERAKSAIRMEKRTVKDLMNLASTLTSRSENFKDMAGDGFGRELTGEQMIIIDKLDLDWEDTAPG